jgi:hypothetical protein
MNRGNSMSTEKKFQGGCFCGAVELQVSGKPAAVGYCHCTSCREWAAAPVNAFTLWPPEAVKITRGKDLLGCYSKTDRSIRTWCTTCGGHLFNEHPTWGVIDVYAAVIPDFPFQPALHVNYAETVLPFHDGLPKQKDYPKEMGGSGELLPEVALRAAAGA